MDSEEPQIAILDNNPPDEDRDLARRWVAQDRAAECLSQTEKDIAVTAAAHGFTGGVKHGYVMGVKAVGKIIGMDEEMTDEQKARSLKLVERLIHEAEVWS